MVLSPKMWYAESLSVCRSHTAHALFTVMWHFNSCVGEFFFYPPSVQYESVLGVMCDLITCSNITFSKLDQHMNCLDFSNNSQLEVVLLVFGWIITYCFLLLTSEYILFWIYACRHDPLPSSRQQSTKRMDVRKVCGLIKIWGCFRWDVPVHCYKAQCFFNFFILCLYT